VQCSADWRGEGILGGVRSADTLAAGTSVRTWRAQSSPRHACGLNVSFFLHTCTRPKPAKAGGCAREYGVEKACGSLHEWGKCHGLSRRSQAAIFRGRSGKGLVFQNGVGGVLRTPYLLGLRANFGGLVMVRLKVSKL